MSEPRGHLHLVSVGGKVVGDMRVFVSRKGDGLAFDVGIARDFELDFVGIAERSKPELFPILVHMLENGCPPGDVDAGGVREVKDLATSPTYSFVVSRGEIVLRWWQERRWWSWEDEQVAKREDEEDALFLAPRRRS